MSNILKYNDSYKLLEQLVKEVNDHEEPYIAYHYGFFCKNLAGGEGRTGTWAVADAGAVNYINDRKTYSYHEHVAHALRGEEYEHYQCRKYDETSPVVYRMGTHCNNIYNECRLRAKIKIEGSLIHLILFGEFRDKNGSKPDPWLNSEVKRGLSRYMALNTAFREGIEGKAQYPYIGYTIHPVNHIQEYAIALMDPVIWYPSRLEIKESEVANGIHYKSSVALNNPFPENCLTYKGKPVYEETVFHIFFPITSVRILRRDALSYRPHLTVDGIPVDKDSSMEIHFARAYFMPRKNDCFTPVSIAASDDADNSDVNNSKEEKTTEKKSETSSFSDFYREYPVLSTDSVRYPRWLIDEAGTRLELRNYWDRQKRNKIDEENFRKKAQKLQEAWASKILTEEKKHGYLRNFKSTDNLDDQTKFNIILNSMNGKSRLTHKETKEKQTFSNVRVSVRIGYHDSATDRLFAEDVFFSKTACAEFFYVAPFWHINLSKIEEDQGNEELCKIDNVVFDLDEIFENHFKTSDPSWRDDCPDMYYKTLTLEFIDANKHPWKYTLKAIDPQYFCPSATIKDGERQFKHKFSFMFPRENVELFENILNENQPTSSNKESDS